MIRMVVAVRRLKPHDQDSSRPSLLKSVLAENSLWGSDWLIDY